MMDSFLPVAQQAAINFRQSTLLIQQGIICPCCRQGLPHTCALPNRTSFVASDPYFDPQSSSALGAVRRSSQIFHSGDRFLAPSNNSAFRHQSFPPPPGNSTSPSYLVTGTEPPVTLRSEVALPFSESIPEPVYFPPAVTAPLPFRTMTSTHERDHSLLPAVQSTQVSDFSTTIPRPSTSVSSSSRPIPITSCAAQSNPSLNKSDCPIEFNPGVGKILELNMVRSITAPRGSKHVKFSKNGRFLAVSFYMNGSVSIYEVATGKRTW